MGRGIVNVPFPSLCWVKRYADSRHWYTLREEVVLWDLKQTFPHDWEQQVWLAKEGGYEIQTKYARYMWLQDVTWAHEIDLPSVPGG